MRNLSVIVLIVLLFSCNKEKIPERKLAVDAEIDALSDLTFFQDMFSLVVKENKLYCSETYRSQILVLNEDMELVNTIGSLGQGPQDLLHISFMTVYQDTVIIADGNQRMQLFHRDGKHIGSERMFFETCFLPVYRFIYKHNIYIGSAKDHTDNALVMCNGNTGTIKYFGNRYKFTNPTQERIRNKRYLLDGDEYLISISNNMPIVEKYEYESGQLLASFDLSDIEPIKSRMKDVADDNRDNTYAFYLVDCNIFNDKVYLLCNMKTDKYCVNNVIVLQCKDDFKVDSRYILPESAYRSIAVNDKYLYAFSSDQCKLQRFKL